MRLQAPNPLPLGRDGTRTSLCADCTPCHSPERSLPRNEPKPSWGAELTPPELAFTEISHPRCITPAQDRASEGDSVQDSFAMLIRARAAARHIWRDNTNLSQATAESKTLVGLASFFHSQPESRDPPESEPCTRNNGSGSGETVLSILPQAHTEQCAAGSPRGFHSCPPQKENPSVVSRSLCSSDPLSCRRASARGRQHVSRETEIPSMHCDPPRSSGNCPMPCSSGNSMTDSAEVARDRQQAH